MAKLLAISLNVNGSPLATSVAYAGNGGHGFTRSDLSFDGALTAADWAIVLTGAYANLSAFSKAEAYHHGDLNADNVNNFTDFRLFKADYDAANGIGAFAAMAGTVPEPNAAILAIVAAVAILNLRANAKVESAAFTVRRR